MNSYLSRCSASGTRELPWTYPGDINQDMPPSVSTHPSRNTEYGVPSAFSAEGSPDSGKVDGVKSLEDELFNVHYVSTSMSPPQPDCMR